MPTRSPAAGDGSLGNFSAGTQVCRNTLQQRLAGRCSHLLAAARVIGGQGQASARVPADHRLHADPEAVRYPLCRDRRPRCLRRLAPDTGETLQGFTIVGG